MCDGRGRYRERQCLGVVGPRSGHELAAVPAGMSEVVQSSSSRRVLWQGWFIADSMLMYGVSISWVSARELGLREIVFGEILALGKGADADRIAVRGDHRHGLTDVLRRRAPSMTMPGRLSRPCIDISGEMTKAPPPSRVPSRPGTKPACAATGLRTTGRVLCRQGRSVPGYVRVGLPVPAVTQPGRFRNRRDR